MARLAQQFRNDFVNLKNSPIWNDLSKEEQQDITQKAKLLLQALHERDSFPEMNEAQAIAETEQQFLEKNRADQGAIERYVTAPFQRGMSNLAAVPANLAAFGLDVVGADEAADEMRKDVAERQQVVAETTPGLGKSYSELTAGDVPQFITDVVGENLPTTLTTGFAGRALSGSKLLSGILPQSGRAASILTPEAVGGAAATYGLMSLPEVYTSVKEAGGGAGSAALFAAPHAILENLGGITPTNVASWFKRGAAKEIASKGLKNFLFDTFKGVLGEGSEEVAQGMVEMAARHFSTKPYDQAVKDFANEVTSPEAIEQMKTEFAGGAAFGVAGGGVGAVQRYADIQQKRQAIAQRKGGREFIAKVTKIVNADAGLSEQMTELKKMYSQETEPGRKEHIIQTMQQLQRAKRGAPSIIEPSEQVQNELLTNLRAPTMQRQAEDAQGMAQNQAFAQSFVEPTPETGTIADYLKYQAEKQQPAPQQPVESYEYPTGAEGLRLMLLDDLERRQQPNQSVVYDPNAPENRPLLPYQPAAVEGRQLPDGGIVKESKNDDIITLKSGEPFKSQKAAQGYQAKNNLKASHDIVATRGGWVLMKKAAQQQSKRITVETPRGGDYNKLNVRTEKNIPTENRTRFTGTPGVAERIEKRLAPSDMETETPADQTTIKQPAPVVEAKAEAIQPKQSEPVKQSVTKNGYKVESYQGGFRVLDPEGKQYSWHTGRQAADDKAADLNSGKIAPVKSETKPVSKPETQPATRITAENAEMLANAQRLRKSAASLLEQAQGDLNRDRQTNTARRARMAAGATDDALNREAFAKTMNNLADAMERGEVRYLKGVKSRPDLMLFKNELTLALGRHARKNDKPYDWYKKEPVTDAAIRDGAEFNRPHPYGDWFDHAARELETIQGMKPAAAYIERLGRGNRSRNVSLSDEAIGKILDIKKTIAKKGIKTPYQFARILETVEDYQKLKAAGIKSDFDLADALIEYRNLEAGKKQESPLVKAERELIGKKFEGFDFFPTPPALAERMAHELDIKPGMKVLEPSAGKGDLADAVKAAQPEADVKVIEPLSDLREILTMKNHEVIDTNFENFETDQKFDRVIMNPPFSKNRDIRHVRKAYELLAPGGKMVAVMGNHFTFANDKESVEFRDWLDTVGGASENLGQAFAGKEAFRQTGVNSQLVTIEKPAETRARTEPVKTEVSGQTVETPPAASVLVKPEEKDFGSATDYLKALTAWREKTGNITAAEAKRRDRALRFADRAAKTGQKASGLFRQADKISERFYMGQPILVGHHSERGARAAQNRMHNKMDAALKEEKKAEYYSQRAESAEKNKSISSADEDAIVKLKAKLESLSKVQERMKQANKVVKASKLSDAEKITKLQEQGFSEAKAKNLLEKDFAGRVGFPAYALQNNNAEMSRLKKRIEELSVKQSQQTQKIEFDGGEIVDNVAENRLQIFFDSKPDEATREKLKSNGFRWAPSAGAWQMHRSAWANRKAESITGAKIPAAQPAQAAAAEDKQEIKPESAKEPLSKPSPRPIFQPTEYPSGDNWTSLTREEWNAKNKALAEGKTFMKIWDPNELFKAFNKKFKGITVRIEDVPVKGVDGKEKTIREVVVRREKRNIGTVDFNVKTQQFDGYRQGDTVAAELNKMLPKYGPKIIIEEAPYARTTVPPALKSTPEISALWGKKPSSAEKFEFNQYADGYSVDNGSWAVIGAEAPVSRGEVFNVHSDKPQLKRIISDFGINTKARPVFKVPFMSRRNPISGAQIYFVTDGKEALTLISGENVSSVMPITDGNIDGEKAIYFLYEDMRKIQSLLGEISFVDINNLVNKNAAQPSAVGQFSDESDQRIVVVAVKEPAKVAERKLQGRPLFSVEYLVARAGLKTVRAGYNFLRNGLTRFADWAKAMLKQFGKSIGPKLRAMFADLTAVLKSRSGAIGGKRPAGSVPKSFGVQSKDLQWVKDNKKQLRLVYNGQTVATLERQKPGGWRWPEANKAWARNELADAKATVKSTIFEELKRAERESAKYKAEADKRQKAEEARNKKHDDYFAERPKKLAEIAGNAFTKFVSVLFDKTARAKEIQRAIEEEKKMRMPDDLNFAERAEVTANRAAARREEFKADYFQPILDDLFENKISYKQFNRFLRIMHAKERNDYIDTINPEFKRRGIPGSGISTKEAQEEIDKMKKDGTFDVYFAIGKKYWQLHDSLLDIQKAYGIMDPDVYAILKNKYEYYTPLRRITEDNIGLNERALGQRTEKKHQLALTSATIDAVFGYGESNRKKQAFALFAEKYPNSMLYERYTPEKEPFINSVTGKVGYRVKNNKKELGVLTVRFAGKLRMFKIKDPSLMVALSSEEKLPENSRWKYAETIETHLRWINNALGAAYTYFNPDFVLSNPTRDVQTALINAGINNSGKLAYAIGKNIFGAIKTAALATANKKGADVELYKEFVREGGKIGFGDVYKLQKMATNLEKEMNDRLNDTWGYATKEAWKAFSGFIGAANNVVESSTRFAAYKAGKEMGMTKQQAATLAAGITVNFNKRGHAAGFIGALWLFGPAGLAGQAVAAITIYKAMKSNKGRALIGAAIAYGFMMEIVNRLLSDYDDDEGLTYYEKISAAQKDDAHIFMIPGRKNPIKIPMARNFNVLPAIGRNVAALMFGDQNVKQTIGNVLSTFIRSFNLLGSDERGIGETLIPTIGKLPYDLATNTDWTGRTIEPEQLPFQAPMPNYKKYKKNTSKILVAFAEFMNKVTLGDEYEGSVLDDTFVLNILTSPAKMEHVLGTISPGLIISASRAIDVFAKMLTGESFDAADVPLVRVFAGRGDVGIFERFKTNTDQISKYRKAKSEGNARWMKDNAWIGYADRLAKSVARRIKEIKKDTGKSELEQREAIILEQKRFNRDFEKIRKQYQGTNLPIPEDEESRAKPRKQRKRPASNRRKKSVLFM